MPGRDQTGDCCAFSYAVDQRCVRCDLDIVRHCARPPFYRAARRRRAVASFISTPVSKRHSVTKPIATRVSCIFEVSQPRINCDTLKMRVAPQPRGFVTL
jgi:hypothetical protein